MRICPVHLAVSRTAIQSGSVRGAAQTRKSSTQMVDNSSMRLKLILVTAVCGVLGLMAQVSISSASLRTERLSAIGRLWGTMRYFHPWIASGRMDWDEALLVNVPKLLNATADSDYESAVKSLLARVGDPVTCILPEMPSTPRPASSRHLEVSETADHILIASIPDYADVAEFQPLQDKMRALIPRIGNARGMIFDLRARRPIPSGSLRYLTLSFFGSRLQNHMSGGPVTIPSQRVRLYSGYPYDQNAGYTGATVTEDVIEIQPAPGAKDRPIVFIADQWSELPPVALGLQHASKARIIFTGPFSEAPAVRTKRVRLSSHLAVQFRISELVNADGSIGFRPDVRVENTADVLAMAEHLVRGTQALPEPAVKALTSSPVIWSERRYPTSGLPPVEQRVLAAFRIWSAIEFFFPYKDLIGTRWESVLDDALSRFLNCTTRAEYSLAVGWMAGQYHDSHAGIADQQYWKALGWGNSLLPVTIRFIEGKPVVTRILDTTAKDAGVEIGDVLVARDGEDIGTRIKWMLEYVPASTTQRRYERLADSLTSANAGQEALLTLNGSTGMKQVRLKPDDRFWAKVGVPRDSPITQRMPGGIGYVDLARLAGDRVPAVFSEFTDTPGIIFDMRGYPKGTVLTITPRLAGHDVVTAMYRRPVIFPIAGSSADVSMLAESGWHQSFATIPYSGEPVYRGRTILLIDERAQSAAEYMGMAFKAANGTLFVGSQTAGANGRATSMLLPGGISLGFTGEAALWPDGRQLQRIGLKPDIEVRPTIRGIREGRDEVLERALKEFGVETILTGVGEARPVAR